MRAHRGMRGRHKGIVVPAESATHGVPLSTTVPRKRMLSRHRVPPSRRATSMHSYRRLYDRRSMFLRSRLQKLDGRVCAPMSTYIIAELGSVHDGSLGNALRLIEECAALGADAVKLQDHRGEKVKGDPPWFKSGEQRSDYLKRTSFTQEEWRRVREIANLARVDLVVSPFSVEAVGLLEELPVDAYKIASGQVTNLPMLESVRKTRRPVFVSSGMTTCAEDEQAMKIIRADWNERGAVSTTYMVCTSEYPCASARVGLHRIALSCRRPRTGFSDHTLGFAASIAAITLGATVIERHVCFDRRGYGTDCRHSLTLDEFGRFIREVRDLDVMLGNPVDKDELANTQEMQRMREAFLEQP